MEKSTAADLLKIVASADPIARQLQALREGRRPVVFSHVIESARAFLVAAIALEIPKTLWVICPSVRTQELLHESLTNWLPEALFLPEAEFLAVENILPDQEIAAERLALLSRVEAGRQRQVIVATRASLEQPAPQPRRLLAREHSPAPEHLKALRRHADAWSTDRAPRRTPGRGVHRRTGFGTRVHQPAIPPRRVSSSNRRRQPTRRSRYSAA